MQRHFELNLIGIHESKDSDTYNLEMISTYFFKLNFGREREYSLFYYSDIKANVIPRTRILTIFFIFTFKWIDKL